MPPTQPPDSSAGHDSAPVPGSELIFDGMEILGEQDCLRLAARRPIGRVGISVGAVPAIFPVNFALVGRDVFFRTSPGTKLDAAAAGATVAFQVDDYDPFAHTGWSVLIVGPATEITDRTTDSELSFALPVRAWARGERTRLVRIAGELITGRRLIIGP